MANLQYKTRGMSNPKGKPRVYFCCHEAEFEKYFETISEEILKLQNCAIWYGNGEEARDEEYLADLGEMQLFVMPVTTRLLTTENAALDVEFRFAIEHHIPVLPLIQESGLDQLFSAKCGDLQYLDKAKSARDLTEIPYEEKLKKYLESVLVSDEMAEKIRAAFDAYVFLSYRKKDRKYAQELMRLIHKNDFCRDIAIWYDEFLTPGENFNESIREALQKSGLFVLTVTPNLVNESNYIMTTEYPMAREEGKPILPAEMVPTNKEKLAEAFAGLSGCTDVHDKAAFSAALLEHVKTLAIRRADDSPEHNFFIGLAYLSGVDVEVDHKRALELIIGAAEHGVVEAVAKLVEMYRVGLGVKRDYTTAIRWQEKKINLLEAAWREKLTPESFDGLFLELTKIADQYQVLGWNETARSICDKALSLFKEQFQEGEAAGYKSDIYRRYGDLCREEGNLAEAWKYYFAAVRELEKIDHVQEISGIREQLALGYDKLGDLCREEGKQTEARDYYEKGYAIRKKAVDITQNVDDYDRLAYSYLRLGAVCENAGELTDARNYYKKAYGIQRKIADELGVVEYEFIAAQSCEWIGKLCFLEGDLPGARYYYERAYAGIEKVVQETRVRIVCRHLANVCCGLSDVLSALGKIDDAQLYLAKAYALYTDDDDRAFNATEQRELAICCEKMGGLAIAKGEVTTAKEHYEKAAAILEELTERTRTAESRRDYATCLIALGDCCGKESKWGEALARYEKAWALFSALAAEEETIRSLRDLANAYDRLGMVQHAAGKFAEAKRYMGQGYRLMCRAAEMGTAIDVLHDAGASAAKMGRLCELQGEFSDALRYYTEGSEKFSAVARTTGTESARKELEMVMKKLETVRSRVSPNDDLLRRINEELKKQGKK